LISKYLNSNFGKYTGRLRPIYDNETTKDCNKLKNLMQFICKFTDILRYDVGLNVVWESFKILDEVGIQNILKSNYFTTFSTVVIVCSY
jgi:hypothetical protein